MSYCNGICAMQQKQYVYLVSLFFSFKKWSKNGNVFVSKYTYIMFMQPLHHAIRPFLCNLCAEYISKMQIRCCAMVVGQHTTCTSNNMNIFSQQQKH